MRIALVRSLGAFGILAILLTAGPAAAAQVTVTSTADSGPGTLRDAIASAQPGDTIAFDLPLPATITLTSGTLSVGRNLTISGPGAAQLTVRRDPGAEARFGIFEVRRGITATIAGLTITGGLTPMSAGGGGVLNYGMLTLSRTIITGNTGTLGAAIWMDGASALDVVESAIVNNTTQFFGGAIHYCCGSGALSFVRSTVAGNTSPGGLAMYVESMASVDIRLMNSTIDGAIGTFYTPLSMTANSSTWTSAEGVIVSAGFGSTVTVAVRNSVLQAPAGQPLLAGAVEVTSLGYNVFSDGSGGAAIGTDRVDTDARLGPLQNNGGPTPTHALLPDSPAIDAGSCLDSNDTTVSTDQRGRPRPSGVTCDIGAFEAESPDARLLQIAETISTQLDATTSSRASQASVDTLTGIAQATRDGVASVLPEIKSRASQSSVDALAGIANAINGNVAGLLPEIRSRASQSSVSDLSTGIASMETAIQRLSGSLPSQQAMTALQTSVRDLETTVAAVKSSLETSSAAATRVAIETALANGTPVVSFMLPAAAGGQLETARRIVADSIAGMHQIHARVNKAAAAFTKGETAYGAEDYAVAYGWYAKAYQELR